MRSRLSLALTAAVAIALLPAAPAVRAGALDRIAVTVGRHVISERDIIQDIRIAAFLEGTPLNETALPFSRAQKRKAADRLVDQYLLLQDAVLTRVALASPADAAPLLVPIKARYASEAEYRGALAQAQITEAELTSHLLAGLRMLRYSDLRFRPEVQLSEENLRTFFNTLAGLGDPNTPIEAHSFEESRDAIEKLLTDQQVMQSLDRWLSTTRKETQIDYREAAFQDAVTP
jgi:hypothetical protein